MATPISRLPYLDLTSFVNLVLYRLGDSDEKVWSRDEAIIWAIRGYYELCFRAKLLWDMRYLEDVQGQATYTIPEDLMILERATWDFKRLTPSTSVELQQTDYTYQETQGPVIAYTMDKDGLRVFRKIRVPAQDYQIVPVSPHGSPAWGIPRSLDELTGVTTISDHGMTIDEFSRPGSAHDPRAWRYHGPNVGLGIFYPTVNIGIPRRVPEHHPIKQQWGIPRRFELELYNVRLEFYRRPIDPRPEVGGYFEIPHPYIKYVLWYVLAGMLERDGPGQDIKAAAHYVTRYEEGVQRAIDRSVQVERLTVHKYGGSPSPLNGPPRPQLPWNYGVVVDEN